MWKQNVGRLDRTLRIIAGLALIPIALFVLGGWQGALIGVLVAAAGLMLVVTGVSGFCPGYVPFRISTVGRKRGPAKTLA